MENEPLVSVAVITRFVREVIGCDCPDGVFRHVEVRRGSTAIKRCAVHYELRIGGRLLVAVTSESFDVLSGSRLEHVISEGKRARDDGKFNRFRLVVQARNAAEDKEKLLRAFEAVSARDAKTHVHVVGQSEVPDFYSP
jgi:predicted SAM-dependent methyltransferase